MNIKEMADEVTRKQLERAMSRRDEAESRYLLLSAEAVGAVSEEDADELERLSEAEMAATDALEEACGKCPNADICIASLRNACPHFIRMVVAGRRKEWHQFLKVQRHFCGECAWFDSDKCGCRKTGKVVEQDTEACGDVFPDYVMCGLAEDPDPMWFPDRPLSPKEQERRARGRHEAAERFARIKRDDPEAYKRLMAVDGERYEAYEREFPELFGKDCDGAK